MSKTDPDLFLIPSSLTQERLWILTHRESESATYNMPATAHVRGQLHRQVLRDSLDRLIERHEVLRTTFSARDGRVVQEIHKSLPPGFFELDLRGLDPAAKSTEARWIAEQEARRPFDLERGPLVRFGLVWLAEEELILLVTLHHIVADGWAVGILIRDLSRFYTGALERRPPDLPDMPIQYADFALWQRESLQKRGFESDLAYWRQQLSSLRTGDLLNGGYLRTTADRGAGRGVASLDARLTAELSEHVRALARRFRTTLFTTLLAAFQILLHRHSQHEDIVIGTPVAGRSRRETRDLIGAFVNTLALRSSLAGDPTIEEFIGKVRTIVADAFAHQEVPFESVLKELRPERSGSRAPIFQVLFNMLSFPKEEVRLPGLSVEFLGTPDVGSKVDLTLYAEDTPEGIRLRWVFSTRLFDATFVAELQRQYEALLDQIPRTPLQRLTHLSLVTAVASRVLPDPCIPLPARWEGAVHERFAEQARRFPERIAISDTRETWTSGELLHTALCLARILRERGAGPGKVVAIYAHRGAPLVLAVLAILGARAAFLILDPDHPVARLADSLRAAKPCAGLHLAGAGPLPKDLEEPFDEPCSGWLFLAATKERIFDTLRDQPEDDTRESCDPDQLAYVAFTSGSTGQPHGILGTHRPLSHFIRWHIETFGFTSSDRFSMLSGLSHDPLLRDLFTPLWLGATLCIPDLQLGNPEPLADWMIRERITVVHLTPGIAQVVLIAQGNSSQRRLDLLRYAFFGGDFLPRRIVREVRRLAPNVTCVNFYGATETPQAMGWFVVRDGVALPEVVPIGQGIDGVQLLVLGRTLQRAGLGEIGEVYVRTPYLALGYVGAEDRTHARFLQNPFTQIPGDRLYRTGDLGRYALDGSIELLGRADRQIKIRGHRIEPGEIEAALLRHPAVREAYVLAAPMPQEMDASEAVRLVAYVVPRTHELRDAFVSTLRPFLREQLPEFMIPEDFIVLAGLPLTPNGKIDHRALPQLSGVQRIWESSFVRPLTQMEQAIAEIWREVLAIERVGPDYDFFELGGNSLLAVRVAARLGRMFGTGLDLRGLFDSPRLADLALAVEKALSGRTGPVPLLPLELLPPGVERPMSFAQQRLWYLYHLAPGSPAYNMFVGWHLMGSLSYAAMVSAFSEIVRRHEVLRTCFSGNGEEPFQRVEPVASPALLFVDLRMLTEEIRDVTLMHLIHSTAHWRFDLARGELLQVRIVCLADGEHVLLVAVHHIICDGWSMGVLAQEMLSLYNAGLSRQPSPLPELPVQYSDFAYWQRRWLEEGAFDHELLYWKQTLQGMPSLLDLPTDRPRPPVQRFVGARLPLQVPSPLTSSLMKFSRASRATLFMTLLSAFNGLLYRYTGREDLAVGTPVAGRDRVEIESLIGLFANTLVLRTDLSGEPTLDDLVGRVREVTLGAYLHRSLPFERLVAELRPPRNLAHTPIFQVMFVLQNMPMPTLNASGLSLSPLPVVTKASRFDLLMSVSESEERLSGGVEYNTDLFEAVSIQRMIGHFEVLLKAVVAGSETPVTRLDLLTELERHQLLLEHNDTRVAYPAGLCVHHLFELQVARNPEALAVVFEDTEITYRELDAQANRLACHLRELGIEMENRVAVCLERSIDLVVSLLAVLKAGGAYVPLDPSYPPDRLGYMLEDALEGMHAPIVLTRSEIRGRLPHRTLRSVLFDVDGPEIARHPPSALDLVCADDQLAYVIYTSGSTGRPKGAMNHHRGVVNRLLWMQEAFTLEEVDRVLQKTPFTFDVSVWEFFWPLAVGARIVLARPQGHLDPAYLVNLIAREGVTTLHFVPSMLQLFLEEPGVSDLHSIRRIVCSGEALAFELEQLCLRRIGCDLFNLYGPTEAAVDVTFWRCQTASSPRRVSIGRPIANTFTYIVDGGGQPIPIGLPGELCIGGVQVALGYLNRPGLTAERFVPDPFSGVPGARLYRTGDLARLAPDGSIEFLGRLDFQIKIRGFRIELGEIEAALQSHPGIQQVVVVAREVSPGDMRLIAYCVPQNSFGLETVALREFLSSTLPEFMVPGHFVFLDTLPLNTNGKVDRKALPPPVLERPSRRDCVAPRGDLERAVHEIWEEVLGVETIGVEDDFFQLGGDSLKAMRMVRRLPGSLGVVDVLREPTIRGLVKRISSGGKGTDTRLFRFGQSSAAQHCTLVCVPYGGGTPFAYYALARKLAGTVDVHALVLPGHDLNDRTDSLVSVEDTARLCAAEIQDRAQHPLALYGHCAGVSVTIELAHQLIEAGAPLTQVFLGGAFPPRSGWISRWFSRFLRRRKLSSDEQVLEYVRKLGAFQPQGDSTQFDFLPHAFRHDLEESKAYFERVLRYGRPKLPVPLVCVVGDRDPLTHGFLKKVERWRAFSDRVELVVIAGGGHYFVKDNAAELSKVLRDRLVAREAIPSSSDSGLMMSSSELLEA